MSDDSKRGFTTSILHSDRDAAIEHGALHKPLHLSVAYGYRDVNDLAAVFHWRPSDMDGLDVRELMEWRERARQRCESD